MTHWRATDGRQRLGGVSTLPPAYGADTTRADDNEEYFSLPASRAPFESLDPRETLRDRVAMGFFLLFILSVAALFGVILAFLLVVL